MAFERFSHLFYQQRVLIKFIFADNVVCTYIAFILYFYVTKFCSKKNVIVGLASNCNLCSRGSFIAFVLNWQIFLVFLLRFVQIHRTITRLSKIRDTVWTQLNMFIYIYQDQVYASLYRILNPHHLIFLSNEMIAV